MCKKHDYLLLPEVTLLPESRFNIPYDIPGINSSRSVPKRTENKKRKATSFSHLLFVFIEPSKIICVTFDQSYNFFSEVRWRSSLRENFLLLVINNIYLGLIVEVRNGLLCTYVCVFIQMDFYTLKLIFQRL